MGEILKESYRLRDCECSLRNSEKLKPYCWQVSYNGKVLKEFSDFISMHKFFVNCKKNVPEDGKALFSWKLMWKMED